MSSIQKVKKKDGSIVFRVQLCVNGIRDSASFDTKQSAKIWSLDREVELRALPIPEKIIPLDLESPTLTLRDVFKRYKREVSSKKAGEHWESIRLDKFCTQSFALIPLHELGPEHLAQWRDDRLKQVSSSTTRRKLTLISHALEVARREWRLIPTNPCKDIDLSPELVPLPQ